jgi:hypothetical protein
VFKIEDDHTPVLAIQQVEGGLLSEPTMSVVLFQVIVTVSGRAEEDAEDEVVWGREILFGRGLWAAGEGLRRSR